MLDKGGMPMYPVVVFAGFTIFTWITAVVASYLDDKPADLDRLYAENEKKAAWNAYERVLDRDMEEQQEPLAVSGATWAGRHRLNRTM
jgi:hypothetical protein